MHSLNSAQINALQAAAKGELYRTTLGTYRISGQRSPAPAAYWLEQAGLIEGAGDCVFHYGATGRGVQGETIRLTAAGYEALNALGVHTSQTA